MTAITSAARQDFRQLARQVYQAISMALLCARRALPGRSTGTTNSGEPASSRRRAVGMPPGGPRRSPVKSPASWRCGDAHVSVRSGSMTRIRVVLAEDHVLLREGVSRLVAANQDLELVGTAGDLPELLALIERERPDVVVTDIRMPPTGTDEGIAAAAWARRHQPAVGVVVLSQYVAPGYAVALLEHGSAGRAYLLKERISSVNELARAIRAVAVGGSVIDPAVVDELVRSRARDGQHDLASLTPRELEILAEMAQGKSNSAIAAALFITERAVEKHTNSIFAKLSLSEERDVNRRVKAVLVYLSEHRQGTG